jgi:hypothetical protein
MDLTPITIETMTATVSRQKALVLCFSLAAGSLYSWLLTPTAGKIFFNRKTQSGPLKKCSHLSQPFFYPTPMQISSKFLALTVIQMYQKTASKYTAFLENKGSVVISARAQIH